LQACRNDTFFDVDLPIGPVDVEAWLIDPDGKRMGAYFVYAEQFQE